MCYKSTIINSYSNWRAETDLNLAFLKNKIPCIFGIDTRYLTKKLSLKGAKKAALINFGEGENKIKDALKKANKNWSGLENLDLAKVVSTEHMYNWNKGIWKSEN